MEINMGSKPKNDTQKQSMIDNDVKDEVSIIGRKLKLMENSISSMRASLQGMEQNFIRHTRDSTRDIKALEEENDELKESMRRVKETMKKVLTDFENAAQKSDVDVIKQYLDLWNPVKFTTPAQVRKLASDVIEEHLSRNEEQRNIDTYKDSIENRES